MTTIFAPPRLPERVRRTYAHADWRALVASLSGMTEGPMYACAVCGGAARYEGQGCADSDVVRLCITCLDRAIHRLQGMRDDAMLATGREPLCNRCWRPILDPGTHMTLRPLRT
jgi:hypothetical protein